MAKKPHRLSFDVNHCASKCIFNVSQNKVGAECQYFTTCGSVKCVLCDFWDP